MGSDQWLEDGDCSRCRRKPFCSKPCKRSVMRKRSIIAGQMACVANAMLCKMFVDEKRNEREARIKTTEHIPMKDVEEGG